MKCIDFIELTTASLLESRDADKNGEHLPSHEDQNQEHSELSQDEAQVVRSVDLKVPTETSKSPTLTAITNTLEEAA